MIKWAGRVLAIIGGGHLALGLLFSRASFGDWLSLRLWGHWRDDTPAVHDFWGNPAGFGLPLLLVGLLVLWMDRRGLTPPAFLAWTMLVWAVACAVIAEPTPAPLLVAAAILLLCGIRRAATHTTPAPEHKPTPELNGL
ncbi:DUF6463 family protein [Microtetraspora malaysiensis]|uniref:DUF6463 family protein n=1 Tax=Microtetraspora malaysiensis TaxID=161358 RepID=A0ABW6SN30_9ACTN